MLQLPRFKDHLKNVGIDQWSSNSALFEHRCLQNIKKLYKHAGKWYNQQQFKDILGDVIVSHPEGFIYKSLRSPMTPTLVKKTSAREFLYLFTNILDVKKKTAIYEFGAA